MNKSLAHMIWLSAFSIVIWAVMGSALLAHAGAGTSGAMARDAVGDPEVDAPSQGVIPALRVEVDPACGFSEADREALRSGYASAARAHGYAVDNREAVLVRVTETGIREDGTRYLRARVEGIGLTILNPARGHDLAAYAGAAAMRIVAALHGSL